MAALLHPQPTHRSTARPRRSSVHRAPRHTARHLRVVPAPTRRTGLGADPLSVLAMAGVIVALMVVVMVRGVQGAPPAADWNGLADEPVFLAEAGTGAGTVTVADDDTWATIAERVAPGVDPIEVARVLASANGGYRLQPGQVLVVPAG